MDLPELPPEALEDLCRWIGEYGWKPDLAARLIDRRYGIRLRPLDAEYRYAVEKRRRAFE